MAFAEDLAPVFDTVTGFAVTATRTPVGGGGASAGPVILDEPGVVLDNGVVTEAPSALVRAATWPDVAAGDELDVDAGDLPAHLVHLAGVYHVRQKLPQDDGATRRLILARVS